MLLVATRRAARIRRSDPGDSHRRGVLVGRRGRALGRRHEHGARAKARRVVSSNLAIALAQAEQRTLIIDADMRRPRMHEVFGRLAGARALSNVLVGDRALADAVRQTSIPNLCVLPAGHIPPNPAELLGSKRFKELLAELGRRSTGSSSTRRRSWP